MTLPAEPLSRKSFMFFRPSLVNSFLGRILFKVDFGVCLVFGIFLLLDSSEEEVTDDKEDDDDDELSDVSEDSAPFKFKE